MVLMCCIEENEMSLTQQLSDAREAYDQAEKAADAAYNELDVAFHRLHLTKCERDTALLQCSILSKEDLDVIFNI